MARIRTYKPELFKSLDVAALPLRARWTWLGLWSQCDDHGRFQDILQLIKAEVWPLDDVSLRDVAEDLDTLDRHGRIVRYTVDGRSFLAVQNWHHHQAINRPGKPKYPAPPVPIGVPEPGENNHCALCWDLHVRLSESSPVDNSTQDKSAGHTLTDNSLRTHGTLTPGRDQGRDQGGDARTRASPEPRTCPKHPNGTDDPCRACADARRSADQQATDDAEQRQAEAQRLSAEARERAELRAQAIAACGMCDADGYNGRRPCDHDPEAAERTQRGRELARAALQKGGSP